MKTATFLVGVFLGVLSGCLVCLGTAMLYFIRVSSAEAPSSALVAASFVVGWAGASAAMLCNERRIAKVLARAFLIGAIEWAALFGLSRGTINKAASIVALQAHEWPGDGVLPCLFSLFSLELSMIMFQICLVGSAIAYFAAWKTRPKEPAAVTDGRARDKK